MDIQTVDQNIDSVRARYETDYNWRRAWTALANKHDHSNPRTCLQQEYIEERASLANQRIRGLMDEYDRLTALKKENEADMSKTTCPICEKGTLTEKTCENPVIFNFKKYGVTMHYSACDTCGSEQANPEQIKENKRLMQEFQKKMEGKA